jgi:hypothetical protein
MPTGPLEVDPAVLRLLLRRLSELEGEAHGVRDVVLGYLPDAGPDIAQATLAEVSVGLSDAFDTLAESVAQTRRSVTGAHRRYVDVDLTVVRDLDEATLR